MTRNLSPREDAEIPPHLAGRSIVLVGLMGAGKSAIGRRLAARLGLPFHDADAEIEAAAGASIADLFARHGEAAFRDGERRVIRRLLSGDPMVLASGGGAFMDAQTRAAIRAEATSVWLRCPLDTLVRRVAARTHRPLLRDGNPREILARLMEQRHPVYAEAEVIVDCDDSTPEQTTARVQAALLAHQPVRRLAVGVGAGYEVLIGEGLLDRAGALLAPVLPRKHAVVITDRVVAPLYLARLQAALAETGIRSEAVVVAAGEASKSLSVYAEVVEQVLALGVERRSTIMALGGGVVGDLAGFVAATVLRGLPFVQIPTTLLAQVDSSVGGKTGVNAGRGKNLVGAFHQPLAVLADAATLTSLPVRELRAGYAEIVKAGLIGDADFYAWCETHGAALIEGDGALRAEAVLRACAFKAAVVGDDEREEKPDNGRALLNLGHTFGHALEAELGYDGAILHGEAVAIGLGLAHRLSGMLGLCDPALAERVIAHLGAVGLPAEIAMLNRRFSASGLIAHMRRDKKMRDGKLHFVLSRGVGQAFTSADVAAEAVTALLVAEGCGA